MASATQTILRALTDRKQMRFVIITAIIYAALLIPFKPFPIIPGFSEARPANFIPALFGVLFGPAAAWGSAIGNLLADLVSFALLGSNGTLSMGSIFGFIGNFLYAYVAWKVWSLLVESEQKGIDLRTAGVFCLSALAGGAVCALTIGMGVFVLGLQTFTQAMLLMMVVTFNNLIPAATIGTACLWFGYKKVKEMGLVYREEGAKRVSG